MYKLLSTIVLVGILAAGCSASPSPTAEVMMKEKTSEVMMASETPTEEAMTKSETAAPEAMMTAKWLESELKDVNTGKTFKLSDFSGKVVYVELMATWCSTCLQQQKNIKTLVESQKLDVVIVSLDIDLNGTESDLSSYSQKNAFNWYFGQTSKDLAREIESLYGSGFLNPPSAPVLVIDKKGEVHPLDFGLKSPEALQTTLAPYLN